MDCKTLTNYLTSGFGPIAERLSFSLETFNSRKSKSAKSAIERIFQDGELAEFAQYDLSLRKREKLAKKFNLEYVEEITDPEVVWGKINEEKFILLNHKTGERVTDQVFKEHGQFFDGSAIAFDERGWLHLIDRKGKNLIPLIYRQDNVEITDGFDRDEPLAFVWHYTTGQEDEVEIPETANYIFSRQGEPLFKDYELDHKFSDGVAWLIININDDEEVYLGDKHGQIMFCLPAEYFDFNSFHEGYALVTRFEEKEKCQRLCRIDKKGKTKDLNILINSAGDLWHLGGQVYRATTRDKKDVYFNSNGRIYDFDMINDEVEDGIIYASKDNGKSFGYYDEEGKPLFEQRFESGGTFHDGWAWVETEGGYSYINKNGEYLTDADGRAWIFDSAFDFSEDRAMVQLQNQDGVYLLNTDGRIVNKQPFASIANFHGGSTQAKTMAGEIVMIDRDGREVFGVPK